MRKLCCFIALTATIWTGATAAQAPAEKLKLLNKPALSLAIAQRMAMACVDKQLKEKGSPVYVAVYDEGANPVVLLKMDGAVLGSEEVAIRKAEASAHFRVPTAEMGNWVKGNPAVGHLKGFLGIQGGLPIFTKSGDILGGIGVSGAPSAEDEACAQAGIDAVADFLQ